MLPRLSAQLGASPTSQHSVFVPVPTITEVCKAPVLTGLTPQQCDGANLESLLLRSYRLSAEKLLLVDSWREAARAQVDPMHRLIVYRENGLDQRLSSCASYVELLDQLRDLANTIGERIACWVRDCQYHSGAQPAVLVTADHGFTYGPRPERGGEPADRRHSLMVRCATEEPDIARRFAGRDMAHLCRDAYFLPRSYVAATSRHPGQGTISGWAMQHGGLLPEEVIVPVVAWFGGPVPVLFPSVHPLGDATRAIDGWRFELEVVNDADTDVAAVAVHVSVLGSSVTWSGKVSALRARQRCTLPVTVSGVSLPDSQPLRVQVEMRAACAQGGAEERLPRVLQIPRSAQLMEPTAGQVAFESMFGR